MRFWKNKPALSRFRHLKYNRTATIEEVIEIFVNMEQYDTFELTEFIYEGTLEDVFPLEEDLIEMPPDDSPFGDAANTLPLSRQKPRSLAADVLPSSRSKDRALSKIALVMRLENRGLFEKYGWYLRISWLFWKYRRRQRLRTRAADAEEEDPPLGQFLAFLARGISHHPEHLKPIDSKLVQRLELLVSGIECDLDARLAPDDE